MKFTSGGIARKNGFRFELKYGSWLHGVAQEKPWFLWIQDAKANEGTYTEHTHRFANEEEAGVFCEKIAAGEISVSQLKAEEQGAWEAHKNKERMAAEAEAKTFLQVLKEKNIDLAAFHEASRAFFSMNQESRDVLADEDAVKRLSAEIKPIRSMAWNLTLDQHLSVYKSDIDVCLWDADTGEHPLPCVCYLSPEDIKDGIEYEPYEEWLLSLPIDHIMDWNGCPLAVLKTEFNYDQTCFLLGESDMESAKWRNIATRADFADADFTARLAYLQEGKPFEVPFDANSMDTQDPADREDVCKLLKEFDHVCIIPDAEYKNDIYLYATKEDPKNLHLIFVEPDILIKHTEPGKGLASTLEGKVAWAEYQKNHQAAQDKAPQRVTEKER